MISICFILFLLISILTSSYGQVTCASGWVQNGGSCYLIAPILSGGLNYGTWDQCNAYCPTSYPGATMFCINNAAENAWIRGQFTNFNLYYIGYTDMPPYGGGIGTKQYGWVSGCSSTYTNWAPGQPNNQNNNQDYAAVDPSSGTWDDIPHHIHYCGCEYTPALTTTSTAPSSHPSTFSPTATPSFEPFEVPVSE